MSGFNRTKQNKRQMPVIKQSGDRHISPPNARKTKRSNKRSK